MQASSSFTVSGCAARLEVKAGCGAASTQQGDIVSLTLRDCSDRYLRIEMSREEARTLAGALETFSNSSIFETKIESQQDKLVAALENIHLTQKLREIHAIAGAALAEVRKS